MSFVTTRNDIVGNLLKLEAYLASPDPKEQEFARELVRLGYCFVVLKWSPNKYLFGPSRFIGYDKNSCNAHSFHKKKQHRDGKKANAIISQLLEKEEVENPKLEDEYCRFCKLIGVAYRNLSGMKIRRKYWLRTSCASRRWAPKPHC